MPAGTSYLFKQGMLKPEITRKAALDGTKEYYAIGVKNFFLHAVHPLAWFKKLEIEIDGKRTDAEKAYFVLRDQWFHIADMPTVTEVYWNLAEDAQLLIPAEERLEQGTHHVKIIFTMSMLEDSQVMDRKGLWPHRVELVEEYLKLEVEG